MALVFQYGSNLSTARLNGPDRLDGGAQVVGVVRTVASYQLDFTVWSHHNNCAAADLVADEAGRAIYGVLYRIADHLVFGHHSHMTLDRIENEGQSYRREQIAVLTRGSDEPISVWTYRVIDPQEHLQTELDYVRHLLIGMQEHDFPDDYQDYVVSRILRNQPSLKKMLAGAVIA